MGSAESTITPSSTRPNGSVFAVLIAIGTLVVLIAVVIFARQRSRADFDQKQQERREYTVQNVLNGRTDVSVDDGRLLEMLADNPKCTESITSIQFFMADLYDKRFLRLTEFTNVKDVGFYDCSNANDVMPAAQTLPQLESLFIEVTLLSDASLELLAEFPSLKNVHFEQVVLDETIARLNELLPNVNVEAPFPASKQPKRLPTASGGE